MTTMVNNHKAAGRSTISALVAGAIGGVAGGAVFGMMMGMMGTLPMVAMLVGSQSPLVGFIVHMLISLGLGGLYGLIATKLPLNRGAGIVGGALYGLVWWVLGALILMPIMLGMVQMVFQIGQTQMFSLVGHLVFGVILGLLFIPLYKRL